MPKLITTFIFSLAATTAMAEAPRVVADIAPVHSLAAQLMQGVGEPFLLIEPTASPHSYALRPSQAASLESADLVLLTSSALTPWLTPSVEKLAKDAIKIELMALEGAHHLESRGSHNHGEDHVDDHDQDHADEHADEHQLDPHGWLAIDNAQLWLNAISTSLIEMDPENAALYRANATKAMQELESVSATIQAKMEPVKAAHYMGLHDAFQYFDHRFGPEFAGSIKLGDATAPSPSRVANAQNEMREHSVRCVFKEPQQNDRLVQVVIEGTNAKMGQLDAIGATLSPGPDLYSELLIGIAESFSDCLAD
ncbi:MAG: zinc ABC transporter substrate-binding protein [Planktotalea sp.]|uniref:zinc ABC transporter substrate-binding protein n=1 Tax=Planktotalea sp. TaxID=2029877 RepID=UPI003C71AADF